LEIIYLDEVDSTQKYLINSLKSNLLSPPVSVIANKQTDGVGSRGNSWIGCDGNLFFSFCIHKNRLPQDLQIVSSAIYFGAIFKDCVNDFGVNLFLKWPNDFYFEDKKAGGMIVNIIKDYIICGIGLNLTIAPDGFASLDNFCIDKFKLIDKFIVQLNKQISWKNVFSKYKLEFESNKNFLFHDEFGEKLKLDSAFLNEDGSITINDRRIYSLR